VDTQQQRKLKTRCSCNKLTGCSCWPTPPAACCCVEQNPALLRLLPGSDTCCAAGSVTTCQNMQYCRQCQHMQPGTGLRLPKLPSSSTTAESAQAAGPAYLHSVLSGNGLVFIAVHSCHVHNACSVEHSSTGSASAKTGCLVKHATHMSSAGQLALPRRLLPNGEPNQHATGQHNVRMALLQEMLQSGCPCHDKGLICDVPTHPPLSAVAACCQAGFSA
jgi:hypothetical protein